MFQGQFKYTDVEHSKLNLLCGIGTNTVSEPAGMTFHQLWLAIRVREILGGTDFAVWQFDGDYECSTAGAKSGRS